MPKTTLYLIEVSQTLSVLSLTDVCRHSTFETSGGIGDTAVPLRISLWTLLRLGRASDRLKESIHFPAEVFFALPSERFRDGSCEMSLLAPTWLILNSQFLWNRIVGQVACLPDRFFTKENMVHRFTSTSLEVSWLVEMCLFSPAEERLGERKGWMVNTLLRRHVGSQWQR